MGGEWTIKMIKMETRYDDAPTHRGRRTSNKLHDIAEISGSLSQRSFEKMVVNPLACVKL